MVGADTTPKGFLAPNANFDAQEEEAPAINVLKELQRGDPDVILSNSFGFGGANATLVFANCVSPPNAGTSSA